MAEGPAFQVARLIVDYLRPIPIGHVEVTAEVERAGRSIRLIRAALSAGATSLAVASALLIRRAEVALDPVPEPPAPPLDIDRYSFVNPDLAVHLHRLPAGEWIGLDAVTRPEPTGIGLSHCRVLDLHGPIGMSLQSQVVERRSE